jgi:hypothetical protein
MHFTNNQLLREGNGLNPFFQRPSGSLFSSTVWKPAWVFSIPSAALPSLPVATLHAVATGIARAFRFSICSWRFYVIKIFYKLNQKMRCLNFYLLGTATTIQPLTKWLSVKASVFIPIALKAFNKSSPHEKIVPFVVSDGLRNIKASAFGGNVLGVMRPSYNPGSKVCNELPPVVNGGITFTIPVVWLTQWLAYRAGFKAGKNKSSNKK